MATILRAPVLSSYPARKTQPAEVWPNLLLSTLALVSASTPLSPVRLDNPRTRPVSGQTDSLQMPLVLRLAPAQKLPVGENGYDEWAQPRIVGRPQDTQAPNVLIRASSPAQLLPVGTNGYDELCQIRVRLGAQVDSQSNLLLSTLAITQQLLPPGQIPDWTQWSKVRAAQDTAPLGNLLSSTLGLTPGPFVPADTSQTAASTHPQDTQTSNALLLRGPVQFLPIGTNGYDEWCQPRARSGAQADGQSNLLTSTLAVTVAATIVQSLDFTQPIKGRFAQADAQPNVLIRDLIPAQLLPVGANSDDFTQPSRRITVQTETTPNLLLSTLLPTQQAFPPGTIGYDEWAQPRVVGRAQDTSQTVNLLSSTLSLTPGPFIPADSWQLGAVVRGQDTQAQNALLRLLPPGQGPLPFLPIDTTQRVKPTALQDTQSQNVLIRDLAPQISPIRPIDTTQVARRLAAQTDAAPNLLTSTLRVVGPLAFVAADWTIIPSKRPGPQDTNVGNWIFQNSPPPVRLASVPTVRFVLGDYPQRVVLTDSATPIVLN